MATHLLTSIGDGCAQRIARRAVGCTLECASRLRGSVGLITLPEAPLVTLRGGGGSRRSGKRV